MGALTQPAGSAILRVAAHTDYRPAWVRSLTARDGVRRLGKVTLPARKQRSSSGVARDDARGSPFLNQGAEFEPALERAPVGVVGGDAPGDRGRVEVEVEVDDHMRPVSHWRQSRCPHRPSRR